MASSVYESINRTRCIRTSVHYNILLVYRNQPKHYRTAMICVVLQIVVTDPHSTSHNSGKLNATTKIRASHYRAGFALSEGTANWKFIFCVECHIFSDTVTYSWQHCTTCHNNYPVVIIMVQYLDLGSCLARCACAWLQQY